MKESCKITKLTTFEEMLPSYPLIRHLTPSLSEGTYSRYLRRMIGHNYFQVAVLRNNELIGVSGYWLLTKLYSGPYLEIDNFVVDEAYRDKGIGKMILDWLEQEAIDNHCAVMMLDAYVENHPAHKFYFRHGFIVKGFHFLKQLKAT